MTVENNLDLPSFSLTGLPEDKPLNVVPDDVIENPPLEDEPITGIDDDEPAAGSGDDEEETVGQVIYGMLKEEGILSSLPEDYSFDGEVSSLVKAFQTQNDAYRAQVQEQVIQSIPESLRDIYEAAASGVTDIDKLLDLKRKAVQSNDISTLDNQKFVIKKDLEAKGIKESVINQIIDSYEKDGSIEAEAKSIVDANKAAAAEEIKRLNAEKKAEKEAFEAAQKAQMEKFIGDVNTNLKELKWSEEKKASITKDLFEVDNTGKNIVIKKMENIFSDPKALIALTDFLQYYDTQKGFDVASFKKVEETEARRVKRNWEEKLNDSVKKGKMSVSGPKPIDLSRVSVVPIN